MSGGKSIRLDAYLPESNGNKLPAVVALHGAGGGVAGMDKSASLLAEQGFAVYVWMKTLWDAVSFVEKQTVVDAQRIALLGFSLGAYLSLANASIDGRVKAVVEFFGGLPREMKLFMRRLCPTLILHGEADPTVPVSEAHNLQRLLEEKGIPHEIKIYPGAGHGFESDVWRDAGLRTLQFLQKHLSTA
jgi:dienelactone hydrolase